MLLLWAPTGVRNASRTKLQKSICLQGRLAKMKSRSTHIVGNPKPLLLALSSPSFHSLSCCVLTSCLVVYLCVTGLPLQLTRALPTCVRCDGCWLFCWAASPMLSQTATMAAATGHGQHGHGRHGRGQPLHAMVGQP